jgi:NitT/TauT family transport system substrate-binding protein
MIFNRRQVLLGATAVAAGVASQRAVAAMTAKAAWGPPVVYLLVNTAAVDLGFMKSVGLDLDLVMLSAGTMIRDSVASGEVDFGFTDASNALQLRNRGRPVKLLMTMEGVSLACDMVVRRDLYDQGITTPQKFAQWQRPDGSKPIIACATIGGGQWNVGNLIFEAVNLGDKVNWVSGGAPQAMIGGIASKQFDAMMATPSQVVTLESRGWGKMIYDITDEAEVKRSIGGPIPVDSIFAREETIANKKDVTQAYITALLKTMRWLQQASVDEIYAKVVLPRIPDADKTSAYAELNAAKKVWTYDGIITEENYNRGGKVWFRETTGIKPIPYRDAVDPQFILAANRA